MTDFLLAITSFVGALIYATVAVAVFRLFDERTREVPWVERVGPALAIVAIYVGVLLFAVHVTHAKEAHFVVLWGALAGIASLIFVAGLVDCDDAVLAFFPAILWPLALPCMFVAWALGGVGVVLARAVTFGSRGPLALGTWLAQLPGFPDEPDDEEADARARRIAEMEKELGL